MSASSTLLHVAAGVCLLLWGAKSVKAGFTRAYGTSLRRMIAQSTNSRLKAFFSGLAITSILQSSIAAIFLLTSFAKRGMIGLPAALAVVMGADIATTLVAQALSFDMSWLAPSFLIIGILAHMKFTDGGRKKHIAQAIVGLGLMLLALSLVREATDPLKGAQVLPVILSALNADPILALMVAAFMTWIMHSSLAMILLFSSLASNGLISLDLGLLLILGTNLGGAFIPFIATYKDGNAVRQITFGNLFMRMLMVILIFPFLGHMHTFLPEITPDHARQLLHFHTGFNIALAVIFLPLIPVTSFICKKLIPDEKTGASKNGPLYLDEKALDTPVMALAGAARETLRIAEIIEHMFVEIMQALEAGDEKQIKKLRRSEHEVDVIYNAIKLYLTRLSQESFDPKEADRYIQILTYVTNLEYVGDVIDKSLLEMAEKAMAHKSSFSADGLAEIKAFHNRVLHNMRLAQVVFIAEDPKLAATLVAGKDQIRSAAEDTSKEHFKRLQSGMKQSIETSSMHLDIIRDYKRINSYITRVAYAIIDNAERHGAERKKH